MRLIFQNKIISYQKKGEGRVIVFLHGFTENKEMWNSFVKEFSKNFQVITIDLPGHGKSDIFSSTHTMEFLAEVVKMVLEKEKVGNCAVVGHSMGAYVGLAFADLFPDLINGLVLFHSSATADDEEIRVNRDRLIKLVNENKAAFVNSFIPSLFAPNNRAIFKTKIAEIIGISSQTSELGITAALEGMKLRTEKLSYLKKTDIPILFISGKQDSRISIEKILPQIAMPKHSYSLILEDVGHMGFIEAQEKTMSMLFYFLDKVVKFR
jgi:pimeloyl-ACP methyl ester carboxylesterase